MQSQRQDGPDAAMDRMWDAVHGSRGDRDLAICEEFNDVEGGAFLSHPTTNQLV